MTAPKSKVAFVESKGYRLKNNTWSWGATGAGGILLLLSSEPQFTQYLGRGRLLAWLCGDHPTDASDGGAERKAHVEAIRSGMPGRAAFYSPLFDKQGREKIGPIAEELWRILEVRAPDDQGRVWASLEKEMGR